MSGARGQSSGVTRLLPCVSMWSCTVCAHETCPPHLCPLGRGGDSLDSPHPSSRGWLAFPGLLTFGFFASTLPKPAPKAQRDGSVPCSGNEQIQLQSYPATSSTAFSWLDIIAAEQPPAATLEAGSDLHGFASDNRSNMAAHSCYAQPAVDIELYVSRRDPLLLRLTWMLPT